MLAYDDLLKKYVPEAGEDSNGLGIHGDPRAILKCLFEEIRTGAIKPESALDEI